jgi:apolipoprotein D and lipocalin family protein
VYRLIWLVLALAACTPTTTPVALGRYRAPDAPIYSNAVLDLSRLQGRWQQVADFANKATDCAPGGVDVSARNGLQVTYRLCLSGQQIAGAGAMRPTGPGRFEVPGQPGPWWVLWADADYRTLVIGTPSGQLGFILNRDGALPPDRLAAAREILDWNGYDLTRLRLLPRR